MNIVYTESLANLPYDKAEILRYSGTREVSKEIDALLEECLKEIEGKITNRICYCEFDILEYENGLDLGFVRTDSKLLKRHLKGCDRIVLFAATIGIEIDRLIAKYSRFSPAKALMLQAIGAERIESLCNAFNDKITSNYSCAGKKTVSRLSPGYGDIALEMQRDIFAVLDCSRKIGLSLNDSLLMSPSKSVTAIIGIGEGGCCRNKNMGCIMCDKKDCSFRRTL